MCLPKFEIFVRFPNFLRSWVLSCLATREETRIPSLLYQVSFCLWWIRFVPKYCKVPIYYYQDCRKIFFLLSTLPMMIQISGRSAHLSQKCYFYQKTTNKQIWKLFKVKFCPKLNMQNNAYTKPLNLEL